MRKSKVENSVRDAFLERIKKPGCPSVGTIAEEMHLPKATLYSWIAAEKQRAGRGVAMKKKQVKRSPLAKLGLVAKSEGMNVDELIRFCEENGISFSELQSWRDLALSAMENSGNGDVISAKFHEQETAKLQAELNRKEKALAEAAALLVLQKKNFGDLGRLKVPEFKKKEILAAIDEAVRSGARLFKACEAIKLCVRRYRRWRKSTADNRGGYRAKKQALSEAEKTEIVERFTSDGMGDLPVNIAHAKLMDSGVYLASASSCARVMNEYYRERNRVALRNPVKKNRPGINCERPRGSLVPGHDLAPFRSHWKVLLPLPDHRHVLKIHRRMVRSHKGRRRPRQTSFRRCHRGALFIMPCKIACACGQRQADAEQGSEVSVREAERDVESRQAAHEQRQRLRRKHIRDDEGTGDLSGVLRLHRGRRGLCCKVCGMVQLRTSAFFLGFADALQRALRHAG